MGPIATSFGFASDPPVHEVSGLQKCAGDTGYGVGRPILRRTL